MTDPNELAREEIMDNVNDVDVRLCDFARAIAEHYHPSDLTAAELAERTAREIYRLRAVYVAALHRKG